MISIFSNSLGFDELMAVDSVFKSRWLGRGSECAQFEKTLARHFSVDEILFFNSCTSAMYTALRALGVRKGDEVILSAVNFVASLSAVLELKANPVFADVDLHTLNIDPGEISRFRTRYTKAVVILHYGGHPADMDGILSASDGIPVVEDSACSISSTYRGRSCGTIGAAGAWSFDAMKILVTGDGGALWISPEYREMVKKLRYLGLREESGTGMDRAEEGVKRWWEYKLDVPSGRFISNDIAAAIGKVQLSRVPGFIERRKQVWETYQRELSGVGDIVLPPEPLEGCTSSYYLYWVQTERRDELAGYLKDKGVYTTFRYYPLHLAYRAPWPLRLFNSERASDVTLNLPLHQNLSDGDVEKIVSCVKEFYS